MLYAQSLQPVDIIEPEKPIEQNIDNPKTQNIDELIQEAADELKSKKIKVPPSILPLLVWM